ncbi:hypothetical protein KT71_15379 [Congregibacter litoralis KT71]|uniref:Lipocalin-like domain protein n=2 Tax=Congregibacter TaxID=393661 RepID=A4A8G4_9GAMM|nr:hypothetical protein KT71_15379 [Congregibacter litoralis KT71]
MRKFRPTAQLFKLILLVAVSGQSYASCTHNVLGDWQLDTTRFATGHDQTTRDKILTYYGGVSFMRVSFTKNTVSNSEWNRDLEKWSVPQDAHYDPIAENGTECKLRTRVEHEGETIESVMTIRFDNVGFCFVHEGEKPGNDCYVKN